LKKVYFIPGLGADSRSFGFLDLSFCQPEFVKWKTPFPAETLATYAERLFENIGDEAATIVGVSFGGMLSVEIAKKHPQTKVIIIASCKTFREIPAYLRFWKYIPLYRLHSEKLKGYSGKLVLDLLGAKGRDQKKVQLEILKDTDAAFTRWAMHAIVTWNNTTIPVNLIHIHGTGDRLLPYRYVKADHCIQKGEHVLIMDHAAEVSQLLKNIIAP
jgi:pimeloyl-ACP methyl ester carboxylesterase